MATSRLDRSFPPILRKRAQSEEERKAAIHALIEYLGLTEQLEKIPFGRTGEGQGGQRYFAVLARGLMRKLIPAFRPARHRSRSEGWSSNCYDDWTAAGGRIARPHWKL
jgi:hypothetical protein